MDFCGVRSLVYIFSELRNEITRLKIPKNQFLERHRRDILWINNKKIICTRVLENGEKKGQIVKQFGDESVWVDCNFASGHCVYCSTVCKLLRRLSITQSVYRNVLKLRAKRERIMNYCKQCFSVRNVKFFLSLSCTDNKNFNEKLFLIHSRRLNRWFTRRWNLFVCFSVG